MERALRRTLERARERAFHLPDRRKWVTVFMKRNTCYQGSTVRDLEEVHEKWRPDVTKTSDFTLYEYTTVRESRIWMDPAKKLRFCSPAILGFFALMSRRRKMMFFSEKVQAPPIWGMTGLRRAAISRSLNPRLHQENSSDEWVVIEEVSYFGEVIF